MSQPGETDNYTVSDHIDALDKVCGQRIFNAVLVQKKLPSPAALSLYASKGSYPIPIDREVLIRQGCRVILANVIDEDETTRLVRHNPQRLARVLLRWYARTQ